MTISNGVHGSTAQTSSSTTCVTPSRTPTGGANSYYLAAFGWYKAGGGEAPPSTVADNKGNTLALLASVQSSSDAGVRAAIYGLAAGAGGAGQQATITFGAAQDVISGWFQEFTSDAAAIVADQIPAGNDDTASPYTSGSGTTVAADEMLASFACTFSSSGTETITWGNSFTGNGDDITNASTSATGSLATRSVSSTGTYQGSITSAGAGTTAALMFLLTLQEVTTVVTNPGFLPAQPPSQFALPPGFVSMPNFGAGLSLGTPAVQLFQSRYFPGLSSPAGIPLLQRRALEELVLDIRRPRPVAARPAPVVSAPPAYRRVFAEDVMLDVRQSRVRALPIAPAANAAPLANPDRFEGDAPVDERPRRSSFVPTTPTAALVPLLRRAEEETRPDEDAARPRPVPLPLQADASPLKNRRAGEQTVPDEAAQRTRPPVAPSVDFAPLPSRRAGEQTTPDEVAARFRQQPAPTGFDAAPLLGHQAIEDGGQPNEFGRRYQQPAPTGFDSAPVPGRRVRGETAPEETAPRYRQQPAPSVDFAPLAARRSSGEEGSFWERALARVFPPPAAPVTQTVPGRVRAAADDAPEEFARRARPVPLPVTADTAPLQSRARAEQAAPEEIQRRGTFVAPAPSVAAQPSAPRRVLEWLGFEDWLRPRRAVPLALTADAAPVRTRGVVPQEPAAEEAAIRAKLAPAPPVAVYVAPPRHPAEELPANEAAMRARAVPPPGAVNSPPLRSRQAAGESVADERAPRLSVVAQSPAAAVPPVARRAAEELSPDERSARAQMVPASSDAPPLRNRSAREEPTFDEPAQRQRTVAPAPVGLVLRLARRLEEAFSDEAARRASPPPPVPPGVAPILGKRSREDGSAPDERAVRGGPTQPAPVTSEPPLYARRATEETILETAWRRVRTFIGFPPAPITGFVKAGRRRTSFSRPRREIR